MVIDLNNNGDNEYLEKGAVTAPSATLSSVSNESFDAFGPVISLGKTVGRMYTELRPCSNECG